MAIEKKDTHEKIVAIIAQKLHKSKEDIATNATLEDVGADSIDMVDIVMKIEEDFDIEIDDEKAEALKNISDVIEYVHNLRVQ